MNDLYRQNQRNVNSSDFEGSGVYSGHYDEEEDKRRRKKESRLPTVIAFFCLLCLAIEIFMNAQEIRYFVSGTCVEVAQNGRYARLDAPDGRSYTIDTGNSFSDASTIKIYYMGDNYRGAKSMTSWGFWLPFYLVFGSASALSIFWRHRLLKPKKHSTVKQDE